MFLSLINVSLPLSLPLPLSLKVSEHVLGEDKNLNKINKNGQEL